MSESIPWPSGANLPLGLFNGGAKDGTTTLLIHSVLSTPGPMPIVVPVKLRRIDGGRYGLEASMEIPPIVGRNLTFFSAELTIKRFFGYEGSRQHLALARCPDDRLQAHIEVDFGEDMSIAGNPPIAGTMIQPCATTS